MGDAAGVEPVTIVVLRNRAAGGFMLFAICPIDACTAIGARLFSKIISRFCVSQYVYVLEVTHPTSSVQCGNTAVCVNQTVKLYSV